jgi:endonuclease/exonuclease/phosphatase family metal-dependent hydrolase
MRRLIAFLFLLGFGVIHAEPLRVTTWNLDFNPETPAPADTNRLTNIVSVLGSLNADVILLQEVPDRQTCERIAGLLGPSRYRVAAGSIFADVKGHSVPQVAILTRKPVASAWTEPWMPEGLIAPPGGLAFAAIRHGAGVVAVYSVQLKNNATGGNFERDTQINILKRELAASQLVRHAGAIEARMTNQPATVIIGGSLNTSQDEPQFVSENTLRLLEEAGFKNAFAGATLKNRVTRRGGEKYPDATFDYVFARSATFAGVPTITPSDLSGRLPVTCDLVFDAPASAPVAPSAGRPTAQWQFGALVIGALSLAFVGWWFTGRKRFYSPARAADSGAEDLLGLADETGTPATEPAFADDNEPFASPLAATNSPTGLAHSKIQSLEQRALAAEQRAARAQAVVRNGLVPYLARLMKDKLFRGVISQRAHLLKVQHAGAAQVAELEQRLVKIQSQFQSRLVAYERRIAELEKEVSAREQANRELLNAKVQLMKQALEAAQMREKEAVQS